MPEKKQTAERGISSSAYVCGYLGFPEVISTVRGRDSENKRWPRKTWTEKLTLSKSTMTHFSTDLCRRTSRAVASSPPPPMYTCRNEQRRAHSFHPSVFTLACLVTLRTTPTRTRMVSSLSNTHVRMPISMLQVVLKTKGDPGWRSCALCVSAKGPSIFFSGRTVCCQQPCTTSEAEASAPLVSRQVHCPPPKHRMPTALDLSSSRHAILLGTPGVVDSYSLTNITTFIQRWQLLLALWAVWGVLDDSPQCDPPRKTHRSTVFFVFSAY